MTDIEINIAIAEACGWKNVDVTESESMGVRVWGTDPRFEEDMPESLRTMEIPSYTADLNAMHEAEGTLEEKQLRSYAFMLTNTVLDLAPAVDLTDMFYSVHAPARQRAEAFLRTLGKWEEVEK